MLTMYSTSWCGYCHRLKSQLDREGIGYTVVDIEKDSGAAEFVMSVNGGNQTVPTVRFPDGSALTNPSIPRKVCAITPLRPNLFGSERTNCSYGWPATLPICAEPKRSCAAANEVLRRLRGPRVNFWLI